MSKLSKAFLITLLPPGTDDPRAYVERATAWVAKGGYVVTAYHFVTRGITGGDWWMSDAPALRCCLHLDDGSIVELQRHRHDSIADIALLKPKLEDRSLLRPHVIDIDDMRPEPTSLKGLRWDAPCYPTRDGEFVPLSLSGKITTGGQRVGACFWQLTLEQGDDDWTGSSGAPIFVGGRVIGMITAEDKGVFWASHVDDVVPLLSSDAQDTTSSEMTEWLSTHGKIGVFIDDRRPAQARSRLARRLYGTPVLPRWWYHQRTRVDEAVILLQSLVTALGEHPQAQALIVIDRYLPIVEDGEIYPWDIDPRDIESKNKVPPSESERVWMEKLETSLLTLHGFKNRCFFRYVTSHPELSFRRSTTNEELPEAFARWKTRSLEAMRTLRDEIRRDDNESVPRLLQMRSNAISPPSSVSSGKVQGLFDIITERTDQNGEFFGLWTGLDTYTEQAYMKQRPPSGLPQIRRDIYALQDEVETNKGYWAERDPSTRRKQRAAMLGARSAIQQYWFTHQHRVSLSAKLLAIIDWCFLVNTSSAPVSNFSAFRPRYSWLPGETECPPIKNTYFGPIEALLSGEAPNLDKSAGLLEYLDTLFLEINRSRQDYWHLLVMGERFDSPYFRMLCDKISQVADSENPISLNLYWISGQPLPDADPKIWTWIPLSPLEFAFDLWHQHRALTLGESGPRSVKDTAAGS